MIIIFYILLIIRSKQQGERNKELDFCDQSKCNIVNVEHQSYISFIILRFDQFILLSIYQIKMD